MMKTRFTWKFGLDVGTPVKGNVGAEGEIPVPNKR